MSSTWYAISVRLLEWLAVMVTAYAININMMNLCCTQRSQAIPGCGSLRVPFRSFRARTYGGVCGSLALGGCIRRQPCI